MRVSSISHAQVLETGKPFSIEFEVENTQATICSVTPDMPALVTDQWKSWPVQASLFPGEIHSFEIQVNLPAETLAGPLGLEVVLDLGAEYAPLTVAIEANVAAHFTTELSVAPRRLAKGSKAKVKATISNLGNKEISLGVAASDPAGELSFEVEPDAALIAPGSESTFRVVARRRRPFAGSPLPREFQVEIVGGHEASKEIVSFVQKPFINRGLITAATLLVILAIWVTAIIFGFGEARKSREPAAAVSENFLNGPLPIEAEGDFFNLVSGHVVTGLGAEPLTGGAFVRLSALSPSFKSGKYSIDQEEIIVGEDGGFELIGLKSGLYTYEVVGDGIISSVGTVMVTGAAAETSMGQVAVQARSGSISGYVVNSKYERIPNAEVSIYAPGVSDEPNLSASDNLGSFEVTGLETPAEYTITVVAPGYDASADVYRIEPGQFLVDVEKELLALSGSIEGLVGTITSSGSIVAPNSLEVVAVSGELTYSATVAENESGLGYFKLMGLPSLKEYVVTLSGSGYLERREVVELDAGESFSFPSWIEVENSNEVIRGSVVNHLLEPVSNVSISIFNGAESSRTVSLSDGSFILIGPRGDIDSVVTFEHPDFLPLTKAIGRGSGDLDVRLKPASFAVLGSVLDLLGNPLSNIEVEARSGSDYLSAVSTPDGSFFLSGLDTTAAWTLVFYDDDGLIATSRIVDVSASIMGTTRVDLGIIPIS